MTARVRQQFSHVCLLAAAAIVLTAMPPGPPALAGVMSFQGIGDLPGGTYMSRAQGISADGQVVVGASRGTANMPVRWTAGEGLVEIPRPTGGAPTAWGASWDGSVIVGGGNDYGYGGQAFRWTAGEGTAGLGFLPGHTASSARGVSADGSVIAGYSYSSSQDRWEPFRWTAATGMVGLGYMAGTQSGAASGISADGSTIVGDSAFDWYEGGWQAWRWTEANGYQDLGFLPGAEGENHRALAVSGDGSAVVGFAFYPDPSAYMFKAWRWTETSGIQELLGPESDHPDFPYGIQTLARAITPDGSVVVGSGSVHVSGLQWASVPVIWDEEHGARDIQQMLLDAGVQDVAGWYGMEAAGVSADGLTIVGSGFNPNGQIEGWVATIPEPTSLALLALAGLVSLRTRARSA